MWMQQVAQGDVVAHLTQSTTVLGLLALTQSAPMFVLSMVGGLLVDRYDRRRVLMTSQIALALLAAVMAWLVATHRLTLGAVFVIALIGGSVMAFDIPAASALVPDLVPKSVL